MSLTYIFESDEHVNPKDSMECGRFEVTYSVHQCAPDDWEFEIEGILWLDTEQAVELSFFSAAERTRIEGSIRELAEGDVKLNQETYREGYEEWLADRALADHLDDVD